MLVEMGMGSGVKGSERDTEREGGEVWNYGAEKSEIAALFLLVFCDVCELLGAS